METSGTEGGTENGACVHRAKFSTIKSNENAVSCQSRDRVGLRQTAAAGRGPYRSCRAKDASASLPSRRESRRRRHIGASMDGAASTARPAAVKSALRTECPTSQVKLVCGICAA